MDVTALFWDAYILGAYFLIEFIDSISLPFWELALVVINDIELLTTLLLLSTILPLKLKEDTPFADSPLVTTYETSI